MPTPPKPTRPEKQLTGEALAKTDAFIQRYAESLALRISRYKCLSKISPNGAIVLDPNADINSYRQLIRNLYLDASRSDKLLSLIRFMVGDALGQGEDIYGEDANCVMGVELKDWAFGTIENMRYVARHVPPENRHLNLSWTMHKDVANLSHEQQRYYLDAATELQRDHQYGWYRTEVLKRIRHDGAMTVLAKVSKDKRDYWMDIYEKFNPHYTKLEEMIEGRLPVPRSGTLLVDWERIKLREAQEKIGGRKEVRINEVFEMIAAAVRETAKAVTKKEVILEREKDA